MATVALTDPQIEERLVFVPGWTRAGDSLTKTYKFDHYLAGVAFANAVGVIAEGFNHHPDIDIRWKKVTVTFTTHDAGSKISEKDFLAAEAIETLKYPKG